MTRDDQLAYAAVHLSRAFNLLNQAAYGPQGAFGVARASPYDSAAPSSIDAIMLEMDLCRAWLLGERAPTPRVVDLRKA